MSQQNNRYSELKYFYLHSNYEIRIKEIRKQKKEGKIVIGYFCALTPIELIYAVGGIPLRLCLGLHETVRIGEEILPEGICSLIKSSLGGIIGEIPPYIEFCDAVINPRTCDGKMKISEIIDDLIPVFTLNVPKSKYGPNNKLQWIDEINNLKQKIEFITNKDITKDKLKDAIELVSKANIQFQRLYLERKSEKPLIMGRDAMLVNETLFYDDIARWIEKTRALCNELEIKSTQERDIDEAPRLMLTGSPIIWPNWKIPSIIEEAGGIIVCDDYCSSVRNLINRVDVDKWDIQDMIRALAERYLMPSTCPFFTPNDDRVDLILQMVDEFRVDGVINNQICGCNLFGIEATRIRKVLEKKKIPFYSIQADYSQEDIGQLRTRIEAFLEMLKIQKVSVL